jgi:hypothetical protein
MGAPTQPTYSCSFCGKQQSQVRRLIGGPRGVYICDEWVRLCKDILDEEEERGPAQGPGQWRLRGGDSEPPLSPIKP